MLAVNKENKAINSIHTNNTASYVICIPVLQTGCKVCTPRYNEASTKSAAWEKCQDVYALIQPNVS